MIRDRAGGAGAGATQWEAGLLGFHTRGQGAARLYRGLSVVWATILLLVGIASLLGPPPASPHTILCRFALYNVLGAIVWSVMFVGAGFFFGNLPFVQKNFTLVVLAIVVVSVVPIGLELLVARREQQEEQQKKGGSSSSS